MENKEKLERLGLLIKKEDLEILEELATERSLGVSTFIRLIALEHIKKLQSEANHRKNDTD